MLQRAILAVLRMAPAGLVDRIRRTAWLAPAVQRVVVAGSRPLVGKEIELRQGPAAGLRLVVDAASVVWATGRVELPVQEAIAARLRPGGVFFDVGANVGFHTLLAARAVGRAGRVVAFEPHPANVRALRRNLEANRLENVLVVPKAVSSRDGAAQLEGRNRATAALGEDGIDVETLTLDGFCDAHPELEPDLVKIDVEGHELDVLAGAEVVLRRARPALVVELHGSLDEVTRATARLGYECQPVGAGTLGSAPHVLAVFRAS